MIPRYERPQITHIFSDRNKFETFLKVELAVLRAMEEEGEIPRGTAEKIAKTATVHPDRIAEIEGTTRHDVIAFCTSITEQLPPEVGRFFHFGLTSSDVIDSATSLQIKAALDIILPEFQELLQVLYHRAQEMKGVLAMGRSHGMMAEPLSFGGKLLGHYAEFSRRYEDYQVFYRDQLTVQFSGAVGNYTILTPRVEEKAARELALAVEPHSTQILPRDRLAKLISLGALTAGAIERLAVEIRHLHRSEVAELHEDFAKGQKGSSIMPHKKNPISGENLTGISRVLRSHLSIALENIVLWHERDISHSSAERLYLPTHLGLLSYALNRLKNTVRDAVFHREQIERWPRDHSSYLSNYYLHQLIRKTTSSVSREELYQLIQKAAFHAAADAGTFRQALAKQLDEKGLSSSLSALPPLPNFEEIKKIYLQHIETVFKRFSPPRPKGE